MKHFKLFLALGILLILSSPAWADIPKLINFQGILDSAGNPLANKTVSVEFKIYDTQVGGALFWSETQSVTTNAGGVFNVILGTSNPVPDSVFDDTVRYLGIKVGTDAEMSPRQQIVSNAYGYRVSTVDGATGGVISGDVDIQSDLTVSGKVGIGTTSPLSKLTVYDNNTVEYGLRVDKVATGGNSQAVSAVNSASPADGFASHGGFFLANANAVGSFGNKVGVRGQAFGTGNDNKAGWFQASGATNNYAIYADLGKSYFAGNVGIGTTNPVGNLHIEGTSNVAGNLRIDAGSGRPTIQLYRSGVNGLLIGQDAGDNFLVANGLENDAVIRAVGTGNLRIGDKDGNIRTSFLNNGNVGIGTTSPAAGVKLDVNGAIKATTLTNAANPTVSAHLGIQPATGLSVFVYPFSGGNKDQFFVIQNDLGVPVLDVDNANKRVSIGGILPVNTLDIEGSLAVGTSYAGTNAAPANGMIIQGNVGIGTTSPSEKLHVVGNICATGTIGACSDLRYKTNLKTVPNALEKVINLKGIYFNWKKDQYPDLNFEDDRQIGFVAQELKEILPEVVSQGTDGFYSIDYGKLTPLLVEAIKEQQQTIEDLSSQLTELRKLVREQLSVDENKLTSNQKEE